MESLIKADVFFFVTTVSLIVVTVILVAALIYILRILRDILHFVKNFREEGERILADIGKFREKIKEEGDSIRNQWQTVLKFINLKKGSGRKPRSKKKND